MRYSLLVIQLQKEGLQSRNFFMGDRHRGWIMCEALARHPSKSRLGSNFLTPLTTNASLILRKSPSLIVRKTALPQLQQYEVKTRARRVDRIHCQTDTRAVTAISNTRRSILPESSL